MKKEDSIVRNRIIQARMNDDEFGRFQTHRKKSGEKKDSTYLRKVALHEPVTILYRNGSADDFLLESIRLKRELNAIGNNFNQAVHKLHILDRIPEFRNWIAENEKTRDRFMVKVDEILTRLYEIHKKWSQE